MWEDAVKVYDVVKDFFGFGDDEEKKVSLTEEKKETLLTPKLKSLTQPVLTTAPAYDPIEASHKRIQQAQMQTDMPDIGGQMPMSMITNGAGSSVSVGMNFTLNGISNEDFANRVIQGISAKKDEFSRIISGIVDDEMRVAYGQ